MVHLWMAAAGRFDPQTSRGESLDHRTPAAGGESLTTGPLARRLIYAVRSHAHVLPVFFFFLFFFRFFSNSQFYSCKKLKKMKISHTTSSFKLQPEGYCIKILFYFISFTQEKLILEPIC